jgi:hypothetical protein
MFFCCKEDECEVGTGEGDGAKGTAVEEESGWVWVGGGEKSVGGWGYMFGWIHF